LDFFVGSPFFSPPFFGSLVPVVPEVAEVALVSVAVDGAVEADDDMPVSLVLVVAVSVADIVELDVTPVSVTAVSVFAFSCFLQPNAKSAIAMRATTAAESDFLMS
jgi:hypothetical protein